MWIESLEGIAVFNFKSIDFYADIFISIIYLISALLISILIKSRNIKSYPDYKYFTKGLFFKIFGTYIFCAIYTLVYQGGDTVNYFIGARSMANLLFVDSEKFLSILFYNDLSWYNYTSFNSNTGFPPWYMWIDKNTFSVIRFSTIFSLISFKSFFGTSILVACFCYIGIWKLYRLFNTLYPGNEKQLAYLMLFLPTLVFWGGGIMKDSYVLGATCWITYNFYKVFIIRKKIFINVLFMVMNVLFIINTKSYVLISLIPGMLLWLNNSYLKVIKTTFLKLFFLPVLVVCISFIGYLIFTNISSKMGVYGNVESTIQKAQIIQQDLLRQEQYGSNNYNIGKFDESLVGLLSVAPNAIFTALFRPLFWEIGSAMMVISVIENTILLLFTVFVFLRTSPFNLFRTALNEPILMYALVFSLLFAYGVGIAGTNFGALVRYKTPLVPFFFPMIYLVYKISGSNFSKPYT